MAIEGNAQRGNTCPGSRCFWLCPAMIGEGGEVGGTVATAGLQYGSGFGSRAKRYTWLT